MFKIGDLVKLDASYHPERHPPMGAMGIVTHVEDWSDLCDNGVDQFVRVHWAGGPNSDEQCYTDTSLKMVHPC